MSTSNQNNSSDLFSKMLKSTSPKQTEMAAEMNTNTECEEEMSSANSLRNEKVDLDNCDSNAGIEKNEEGKSEAVNRIEPDVGSAPETYVPYSFDETPFSEKESKRKKVDVEGLKNKINLKKVIPIVCVAIIAVLAVGIVFGSVVPAKSAANKIKKDFLSTEISSIYSGNIQDSSLKKSIFTKALADYPELVKREYLSDNLSEAEAVRILQSLSVVDGLNKQTINECKEYITTLEESHKAYEQAESLFQNSNYKEAIVEYVKVVEEDDNYSDAQEKIKSCSTSYKAYVLSEADAAESKEQYEDSIELLENAVKVIPNDSELDAKLSSIKSDYAKYLKTNAINNASQLIKDAKFEAALSEIDEAIKFNTSDKELKDLKDVCINEYEKSVIKSTNDLILNNRYEAAIGEVESALLVLPNNENLTKQLNKIQSNKPISLSTLTPINGGWEWNEGSPTDPFGNTYSNVSNYKIFYGEYNDEHYAEYRVYGKYKKLTASLISHMDIQENGNSQIQVYADDKLVYTSPTIGRKTDIINVSVNVSGADYIKIVVQVKDNHVDWASGCNGLIMMDTQLWSQ